MGMYYIPIHDAQQNSHVIHWVHSPYMNIVATQACPSQLHSSMQASKIPHIF